MNGIIKSRVRRHRTLITITSTIILLGISLIPVNQLFAANFANGESANGIIGQYSNTDDYTSPILDFTKGSFNNGANKQGLNAPGSVSEDTTNHRLFVADSFNNRVLVYNLSVTNTLVDLVPDFVLGQASFITNSIGLSDSTMYGPQGLAYDEIGQRLFVVDQNNNRVLIFDVASITNGESAIHVLGQADFVSGGTTTTSSTVKYPMAVYYDQSGDRLFLADSFNNRVLVFDTSTITDGQSAINVLGQADFVSNGSGTSSSTMNTPSGLSMDTVANKLYVSEVGNNRVLIFDSSSITDGQSAINVLGQADFVSNGPSVSATNLNAPQGIVVDSSNHTLYVSDASNNRVMVFDITAPSDGDPAVHVLGQPDFVSNAPTATSSTLNIPQSTWYDSANQLLYIADGTNNRIIIHDVSSISDGQSAIGVLGQYSNSIDFTTPLISFTKGGQNNGPSKLGFSSPGYIVLDQVNHRLFLSDTNNNRVLVYNLSASNALTDLMPDNVLGQPDFYTNTVTLSDSGMYLPAGLVYDDVANQLYVADSNNNRILIFDVSSITDGEAAINVLGQTDFVSNGSATTSSNVSSPQDITLDETNHVLYVADSNNNRVLLFDVLSVTDGESAINVLGQADFVSNGSATTDSTLSYPQGLAFDDRNDRLFVGDTYNNRVLVFSTTAVTDGQPAVNVLGEPDFTTASCNITDVGVCVPKDLFYDSSNSRLFIDDNSRILTYNVSSITDGQPAVNVLGAPDFTTTGSGVVSDSSMNVPTGFAYNDVDKVMYVVDTGYHRVLLYEVPALPELQSITSTNSNGTYTVSNMINLTATFDEPVDPTSTLTAHLNNGVTVPLTTVVGNTISADYVVGAGEDIPVLNVASISGASVKNSAQFIQTDTTLPTSNLATSKSIAIVTVSGGGGGGSSSSGGNSVQKVQRTTPGVTTQPPQQSTLVAKLKSNLANYSQSKLGSVASFCISPTKLTRGAKGLIVKELQQKLKLLGAKVVPDGVYGKGTYTAVMDYQRKNKLVPDGRVGIMTRDSICGKTASVKSPK